MLKPVFSAAVAACLVVVSTLAIIPPAEAVAIAQDNSASTPVVASPSEQFTPVQFGKPLAVEFEGKEIRTIFMFEGRSTADQRDPARVVYYHGLDLALVPRKKHLPGFPLWVQDVTQRDDETVIEVCFRLSSRTLRSSCEAKLNSDMRDFFKCEKSRLKVDALKVEVQKVPAWELFIAIQDSATKLTLSYDSQHIANLGEEVTMSFRLKPESLALFMRCNAEGKLQFKPYYKVRADQIITAEKQTDVAYDLGLNVKQRLDHRQRSKLKNDDEFTIYPILVDHVNRIARQVTMDVKTKIVGDPSAITFLHNDTLLVTSCFDPASSMSYDDFQKAFPKFTDEMLAEYLKPYLISRQQSESTEKIDGKQHTDEKTSQSGGGFGLSLAIGPLSLGLGGSKESADRVLDTIYSATGIRFAKAEGEQFYKPAELKVHKLAEGYEDKKLNQASSVTLVKGPMNSYLEESPFPQTYVVQTVDSSLKATLEKNDHVSRLLAEIVEREGKLEATLSSIAKSQSNLKGFIKSINANRRVLHDSHLSADENMWNAGRHHGIYELIIHAGKIWNWSYPGGNEYVGVVKTESDRLRVIADSQKAIAVQANASIETQITKANAEVTKIAASQAEIAKLRGEIDKLNKQTIAILER